jgi:hypothetical protein
LLLHSHKIKWMYTGREACSKSSTGQLSFTCTQLHKQGAVWGTCLLLLFKDTVTIGLVTSPMSTLGPSQPGTDEPAHFCLVTLGKMLVPRWLWGANCSSTLN